MCPRRDRIKRVLPRLEGPAAAPSDAARQVTPKRIKRTVIDFKTLALPKDVQRALADAFWNHLGSRPQSTILHGWHQIKIFPRFLLETQPIDGLDGLDRELLSRYIVWLNQQSGETGVAWTKATRAIAYGTLQRLLRWLQRCRPGLLQPIEYPVNPFPFRNRDRGSRGRLSPEHLRDMLRACERDIEQCRALRQRASEERLAARAGDADAEIDRGALLDYVERRFEGIIPTYAVLRLPEHERARCGVLRWGGVRRLEPCLYPTLETLLPYYLAILIHTAGNPQAIAHLSSDCLQPVPLMEDRELIVWEKPRAGRLQRRSFRSSYAFEPPALVRDLLDWTSRLRRSVSAPLNSRLFLFKSPWAVSALPANYLDRPLRQFEARHHLKRFTLASIRPTVLTSIYRHSGDLLQARAVANHARLSTTVQYVQGPEVQTQNRSRIAILQHAFVGHIERGGGTGVPTAHQSLPRVRSSSTTVTPAAGAVSMFGFDCTDPMAGVAPGTRAGELCSNFLGCFTCPNAVISHDVRTLARLLQARDHLRHYAAHIHPARWEAIYAPPLRILEEDILARFAAAELAQAKAQQALLSPLPPLR
jgi:hypothetical protein